jgi:signal transduction histidine kinase
MPEGSIRQPFESVSSAPMLAGEPPSTIAASPIRVLHVEDNLVDAELVSAILQAAGLSCSVRVVDTEAAFRTAVAVADIDLVICDYSIPSFSGLAALAIARSARPDLPFIFVSGTIGEERAIDALKEGATDYVLKQRLGRLGSAVRRALAERAAHQARAKAEREQKRAEAALQRQAAALAQTEKLAAMGSLLAGVAHELNNPLAVVVGYTHLLRRGLEGAQAERATKISSAAERCARIVKNFLALARQRPPERQWVHLDELVEEALELVNYSLNASGIEVVLDLAADLPALWADPHQLHQVMVNLITNAQQALRERPPGQRRLLIGVAMHDERTACVEVVDTGPGIPAEIVSRIFEPFFTTKPPGEGTGLGLSLCRGIVESHGGTMRLHTDVGRGTVFRIELPITRGPVATAAVPEEAPTRPGVGTRLLVVDDETALGAMIAEMLTTQGHRVDVVTDGQQALEKLAACRYDVVLSDLRMPGLDGPGLYAEVQKRHPGQERRFVFITGDTFTGGTAEFLERSGVPSLAKPFTLEEIARAVAQIRSRVAR